MIFNKKDKLVEETKMYGSTPYRRIKKAVMECELKEDKSECKKIFKEMGIDIIE